MRSSHVVRDGVRLAFTQIGSGPLVVLVQGLGVPGSLWLPVAETLAARGFTAVMPDNRGCGDSDAARPYRMDVFADDLAAVIRAVDAGPALAVGISLGGMIAQHLALRHPDAVAGLVLAATTCGLPAGRLPSPRAVAAMVASVWLPPERCGLDALLAHPDSLVRRPDLLQPLYSGAAAVAPGKRRRGMFGQLMAAALHSTGSRLSAIRCPTEVITGADDRTIPATNSRILAARIPGAVLTVVPRTGHVFPLEEPTALPAAILRVAHRLGWNGRNDDAIAGRGGRGRTPAA